MSAADAKLLQSCLTLCDPIDGSLSGSVIPGILQARTLEWVAISFSNARKWKVKVKSLSHVWLVVTHGLQRTRLLHPWDFPGKNTGVGCHCLLIKCLRNCLKGKLRSIACAGCVSSVCSKPCWEVWQLFALRGFQEGLMAFSKATS